MLLRHVVRAALLAVIVVLATTRSGAREQAPPSAQLFDRYLTGDRAAVVAEVAGVPDFDRLARDITRRLNTWVRERHGTSRARLDVATFLLDVAAARLETDWFLVRDFVEVGCRLVAPIQDEADAVRRWHLAALALVEGAADAPFLLDRPGRELASYNHLAHGREKAPDEPRFRLAEVVASTMGFADQAPPRDRRVAPDSELEAAGSTGRAELAMRRGRRRAFTDFVALTQVPAIADEAHLRAGYQAYQLNDNTAALEHLAIAGEAEEPFVAFNAHLLAAMTHSRMDNRRSAEASLRKALMVVPFAQSATQLLSSQLFLIGRTAEAHDLVDAWFARRTRPADPWRMFGYGDFRMFTALMADARRSVGRASAD